MPAQRRILPVLILLACAATPPVMAAKVEIIPDVVYGHKDGMALTFDVLRPKTGANGAAVLFMVSGGWVSRYSPPEQMAERFKNLLDKGFTVIPVRHGSSPKYVIPEIVADVRRAVRFIRHHAARWSVDPNRLGVYGGSAGGHLSLVLGTSSDNGDPGATEDFMKGSDRVASVVAFFPPVDLRPLARGPNPPPREGGQPQQFPALNFDKEKAADYSPIVHVSPDDPPTLLIHGDKDPLVPVSNSHIIHEAFQQNKVRSKVIIIEGAVHGFRGEDAKRANDAMVSWFEQTLLPGSSSTTASARPTFTKDVAPILNDRCVVCHRPGDIAPMPLQTYEQVRPWASAIKEVVLLRRMPPWFADPRHGQFRNDRRLSQAQVDTLIAWASAGAPRGDAKDLPPPPKFPDGWTNDRPPDLVVEMPVEVKVPATGVLDMQNYYVKVPFTEEKFVEAVELRPGNRAVVHHSIVNIVTLPDDTTAEQRVSGKKLGRTGWKLIGQAPGKGFERHHEGTAKRIVPGSYFEFNMHYTPTGKREETDRTVLGLWFARGPVQHEVMTTSAAQELYLNDKKITRRELPNIPANAPNWAIAGKMNVKDDITVYSLSPHMHFRGKDMKFTVTHPDGREQVILNVPNYHYQWQLNYEFETPVKVPGGSVITVLAHFDNSRNNPRNPAPDEEVIWGQQSWNEMFIPWMEYSVDKLARSKAAQKDLPATPELP